MGGESARVKANNQEPVVKERPPEKKARGGFYGAGLSTAATMLGGNSSKRATFLGY